MATAAIKAHFLFSQNWATTVLPPNSRTKIFRAELRTKVFERRPDHGFPSEDRSKKLEE